ncbi:uncharacterized protein LOC100206920 [Hydra vulgaris]|uniref:uncharacterized protein LOC100206920 n=1 Tax=Hydra vulgaris TaxID=6087 RepID=UPI00019275A4|nr:uncharacterized protein LOC100206920 [Hydra vulgaris]
MARRTKQIVAIIFTSLIFIIHLVFNGLAGAGDNNLFPTSVGNISNKFSLEITPVSKTFSIWGVIFTYQVLWIIYAISTIFRNSNANKILSTKFFVFFNLAVITLTVWLFVWCVKSIVGSFVVLVIGQIFLDLTLYFALTDFYEFTSTQSNLTENKWDLWAHRILVQNGILFYGTWTTVASLINTGIFLKYELEVKSQTASLVGLSILAVLILAWFILENFVLTAYTGYTFTAYIVLIWAFTGIHIGVWNKNTPVAVFNCVLLVFSCLFLVARIVILIVRNSKKASYETIGYDAKQGAVRT